jgi:SulP family sulfate permease
MTRHHANQMKESIVQEEGRNEGVSSRRSDRSARIATSRLVDRLGRGANVSQAQEGSVLGDLYGGTMAALLSLPAGLAYGVLVFGSLGPAAISRGVVVGLTTLIFLNLASALLGGCRTLICSPTSLPTLVMAAAVPTIHAAGQFATDQIFLLVFLATFLAGLLQVGFGLAGIGELVKFIPFPVRCGLLTGTGVLMLKSQIPSILGIERGAPWSDGKTGAVAVVLITMGAVYLAPKISRKIPAALVGLVAGTIAYWAITHIAGETSVGPLLGAISSGLPDVTPGVDTLRFFVGDPGTVLGVVFPLAVGVALMASMETLVAVIAGDKTSGDRTSTVRELAAQGVGNMATAIFGGIAGAGSPSRTVVSYNYGARSTRCRLAAGSFSLAVLVGISRLIASVPVGALAGVLAVLALNLFDPWILRTAHDLARGEHRNFSVSSTNLVIALAVVLTMVMVGVLEAIALGVVLSVVYFVARMGRRVVRREYGGGESRSNVLRSNEELAVLAAEGDRIRILELEGSLFFGTADRLGRRIERICEEGAYAVILDLKLVAELDMTAAMILPIAVKRCRRSGATLMLSYKPGTAVAQHVQALGVEDIVGSPRCFEGINDALGAAEDLLLDHLIGSNRYDREHAIAGFPALSELDRQELDALSRILVKRELHDQEVLFSQGDDSTSLFFLSRGRIRIVAASPGEAPVSLAMLCPNMLLGELALVDRQPRSASAQATGRVVLHELQKDEFEAFLRSDPTIAGKVYAGIAREIATRLRAANRTVR